MEYKVRVIGEADLKLLFDTLTQEQKDSFIAEEIEKGQSYREYVGKLWGDFYSTKLHMDCHYMVEAYFAETDYYLNPDEGWNDQIVMDFVNQWLMEDGIEPPELKRDAIKLWLELYGSR